MIQWRDDFTDEELLDFMFQELGTRPEYQGEPSKYGWYREWEGEVLAEAIGRMDRGEADQSERPRDRLASR
jgi:hypothetical protein